MLPALKSGLANFAWDKLCMTSDTENECVFIPGLLVTRKQRFSKLPAVSTAICQNQLCNGRPKVVISFQCPAV